MSTNTNNYAVYQSVAIPEAISPYWRARRQCAESITQLLEHIQTRALSEQQLQQINQAIAPLLEQDAKPLIGRKAWLEAEQYGHNGVMHCETTPISGFSNPVAPALSIWLEDNEVLGKLNFSWLFEGGNHRAHGGSIAAVFDEFLATAMALRGKTGVTAYLTTNYRKFTPIDQDLDLKARIKHQEGKKLTVIGEIWCGDELTADAEALFIVQSDLPKR